MRIGVIFLLLCSLVACVDAVRAAPHESARFVQSLALSDSARVMVVEGENEPRSIGSYTVRLYGGANSLAPYDDFQGGAVFARDGFVESIEVSPHRSDRCVLVNQRSAGSGSYVTADVVCLQGRQKQWRLAERRSHSPTD